MNNGKSIPELFGELVDHLSTLFRKEIQLAKTEAGEKVQQATRAGAMIAIGGVVLLAALIIFLNSIVEWLVVLGLGRQWATLIVAIVIGIIGYVLLRKGIGDLKAGSLAPNKTLNQLRADAHTAKEQI